MGREIAQWIVRRFYTVQIDGGDFSSRRLRTPLQEFLRRAALAALAALAAVLLLLRRYRARTALRLAGK